MATVRASRTYPGSVHEAETLWYDTARWPTFIDGLAHVEKTEGDWPSAGSRLVWHSHPAGRGRVVEHSTAHEPLSSQTLEIEDESIRGKQSVTFTPVNDQVEVALTLEYRIKKRSIVTPLIDLLFILRAMTASLARTLTRFGVELRAEREQAARN